MVESGIGDWFRSVHIDSMFLFKKFSLPRRSDPVVRRGFVGTNIRRFPQPTKSRGQFYAPAASTFLRRGFFCPFCASKSSWEPHVSVPMYPPPGDGYIVGLRCIFHPEMDTLSGSDVSSTRRWIHCRAAMCLPPGNWIHCRGAMYPPPGDGYIVGLRCVFRPGIGYIVGERCICHPEMDTSSGCNVSIPRRWIHCKSSVYLLPWIWIHCVRAEGISGLWAALPLHARRPVRHAAGILHAGRVSPPDCSEGECRPRRRPPVCSEGFAGRSGPPPCRGDGPRIWSDWQAKEGAMAHNRREIPPGSAKIGPKIWRARIFCVHLRPCGDQSAPRVPRGIRPRAGAAGAPRRGGESPPT